MKYYLCALLVCGAFFSRYVTAQDPEPIPLPVCDMGETVLPGLGCGIVAPEQSCKLLHLRNRTSTWGYGNTQYFNSVRALTLHISSYDTAQTGDPNCGGNVGRTITVKRTNTHDLGAVDCPSDGSLTRDYYYNIEKRDDKRQSIYTQGTPQGTCEVVDADPGIINLEARVTATFELSDEIECPESHPLGPVRPTGPHELNQWCYRIPVDEPPEECDDIVGNCEPDPDCVAAGGGSMVCKADPDEKCWVDAFGDTQCEEGCGYVNEDFFCMTEPTDNPDFAKCKFTFNGYACPSEPDDDIPEPDKPLPDMKKQDFKDVNVGIETRQDKTNDLIETLISTGISNADAQAKADAENTKKINEGQGKSNDYLKQIDLNTKKLADALAPEETREIGEPESWYESVYEDGIAGVWDEHKAIIMQAPIFEFIDQFSLAPSGSQPDWTFNLNLGAMGSYGTHSLEVPAFVWNFIRICMLLGASFTARRLIFGG